MTSTRESLVRELDAKAWQSHRIGAGKAKREQHITYRAARFIESVPDDLDQVIRERGGLIAVRDALLIAGGADPSNGVCRFSYWNLDKLNRAFDAALATIKGEA